MTSIQPKNGALLADLELFVVATSANLRHFELAPFDVNVRYVFDPLQRSSASFLRALGLLDGATFGPEGMPMPRWIFFNGAELPGGIVGFGQRRGPVADSARQLLGLENDGQAPDLIPLSMFIAIPTARDRAWLGHNLGSLANRLRDPDLRGLGSLTKAMGLRVFRAQSQVGVTQWASPALRLHTRLGPLGLDTAWTPAHSEVASLTYRAQVHTASLRNLAHDPRGVVPAPAPDRYIDSADHQAMQELQARIEDGEQWEVVGRPEVVAPRRQRTPIRRVSA